MGLIGGKLGYHILKAISADGQTGYMGNNVYAERSKLATLLGDNIWEETRDKVVIDFGCGTGVESVELAEHGAKKVIGVEIQDKRLQAARQRADEHGVADRCLFTTEPVESADVIVSLDSFEHFDDPAEILRVMHSMLNPNGSVLTALLREAAGAEAEAVAPATVA